MLGSLFVTAGWTVPALVMFCLSCAHFCVAAVLVPFFDV